MFSMVIFLENNDLYALRNALNTLRENQSAAAEALAAFEARDLPRENAALKAEINKLNASLNKNSEKTAALERAYEELNRDFKHEMTSKRTALLGLSENRHKQYLTAGLEKTQAQTDILFEKLRETMRGVSAELRTCDSDEAEPLLNEMADLRNRAKTAAKIAGLRREKAWAEAAESHFNELGKLKSEPLDDAALRAVRKFFQWEAFLGLKIISAAGMLLILFGVFTFGRFMYGRMTAEIQCAAIFALGLLLMGAGEFFHRRKWRSEFAVSFAAGGSGVLFIGTALGHMTLGVLPMVPALVICVAASALSFGAALRYNAQLVGVFALVGGYLPVISLTDSIIGYAMVYFMILSMFTLLLAARKNWRVTRFFGLFAGIIAEFVLSNMSYNSPVSFYIGIVIIGSFFAYLTIPIFGKHIAKAKITTADIVLVSCNIFFRYILTLYWLSVIYSYYLRSVDFKPDIKWDGYAFAFASAFFGGVCILTAYFIKRYKNAEDKSINALQALFFITSVSLYVLVVLFALDSAWFSIGWLVQALGLAVYGIYANRRRFTVAGCVIGALCLFSFFIFNVSNHRDPLFVWQYLSITLALAFAAALTLKFRNANKETLIILNILRGAAVLNVWFFGIYALSNPLMPVFKNLLDGTYADAALFAQLLLLTFGFALAFFIPRIKRVYNYGFQIASIAIGVVSAMWLVGFNYLHAAQLKGGTAAEITAFTLYVIVNLFAVVWTGKFFRLLAGLRVYPITFCPLLISGFFVLLASQNLVVQLSLKPQSLVLTLVFGLTALGWILFGFIKRNGMTRVSGLALSFFAVIKLFVLDLHGLEVAWRIVSYFTAGVVLLLISFTYQWFNKRAAKEEALKDG
jgi:uncharacterized membrane protein